MVKGLLLSLLFPFDRSEAYRSDVSGLRPDGQTRKAEGIEPDWRAINHLVDHNLREFRFL
jgi:hypothetical protein